MRLFVLKLLINLSFIHVLCIHRVLAESSQNEFWDETEPFGQTAPTKSLRLTTNIVPSFYRLKKKIDVENLNFSGTVYITLRAKRNVSKIILHCSELSIDNNIKLTEQTYEVLPLSHLHKVKREVNSSTETTIPSTEENSEETSTSETYSEATKSDNSTTENVPKEITQTNEDPQNTTIDNPTTLISTETSVFNGSYVPLTEINSIQNEEPRMVIQSHDTQVTHSNIKEIKILTVKKEPIDNQLVLTLATDIKPNIDYILEISFNGTITNSLRGLYKSPYLDSDNKHKWMAVTQFEPVFARAAFPCFDQPEFKAMFEISIAHDNKTTALSNMGVSSEEDIAEEPGWKWTHFERSVKMSTYLVAYALSEFKSLETTFLSKDNTSKTIKVWAQPNLINKAKYAVSIAPKLLNFYEYVFGYPYVLDKIDLVAIPDFSSGAMENWGLMTFRETTLLFDEKDNIPHDKQNVAIAVAHELAHQWFGNLVTMTWWNDLWLNEGFATYIEYVGVNHIEPQWNILESFTTDKMDLLRSDALKNTSPVSKEVSDASEISQKFNEISYAKGASLIRMLNHTISYDLFHEGLVHYLDKWKFVNAEENDLWDSMSEAIKSDPKLKDISIVAFMNTWTRQAGYPLLTVKRDYKAGKITFEQKLFSSTADAYKKMLNQLWQIPISYAIVEPNSNRSTVPKLWLKSKSTSITVPNIGSNAFYVNVDAIGYYRVNYDTKNWALLIKALKNGHIETPITKAQLIDDAFNVAKDGKLDYSYALDLTTFVIDGEDSKTVWDLILTNMAFLKYNLKTSPFYVYFQDFMKILLRKQLKKLNYGLDAPKDDNEAFLIENLVMWECDMESPRCLKWARSEFDKLVAQPDYHNNPIPSYLRSLVYAMALKHGGRAEFDYLWNIFENTTDPNIKDIIINNIACTRNEELIAWLLEKSLTDIPNQYATAAWRVDTPIGYKIAQDFLINNWDRIYRKFSQLDPFMFPAVLNGAFGFITSNEELNKLKSFALKHKNDLIPLSQTLQKLVDTANVRINWLQKQSGAIEKWLKDYVTAQPPMKITTETTTLKSMSDVSNISSTISVANATISLTT